MNKSHLYFAWVFPFDATLYFYSTTFQEILHFSLHYIDFIKIKILPKKKKHTEIMKQHIVFKIKRVITNIFGLWVQTPRHVLDIFRCLYVSQFHQRDISSLNFSHALISVTVWRPKR